MNTASATASAPSTISTTPAQPKKPCQADALSPPQIACRFPGIAPVLLAQAVLRPPFAS